MALETCTICGRLSDTGVFVEKTPGTDASPMVGIGRSQQEAAPHARRAALAHGALLCHDCIETRSEFE